MKQKIQSNRLTKCIAAGLVILGLLAPTAAWAAPPLPVPSAIFYGHASGATGLLANGTIKLALPGGAVIAGSIGSVSGTGYNYSVALPLGLPSSGTSLGDPGTAGISDTIRFYLNDTLAVFRDQGGITRGQFAIPQDAIGKAYLMDLALVGPESYPLGDVNVSGVRDSADSLLVLRYDVGLTLGGTVFPPPPRTIYVPLCDIVQDGKCNSSDALRILQCDAGMPGVTCPATGVQVSIASAPSLMTDTATLALHTDFTAGPEAGQVTVRVLADDPLLSLGAATVDLHYDPAAMTDATCTANPAGNLDAAFCNGTTITGTGTVRVSAVSVQGAGPEPVLSSVSFRLADPSKAATTASLGEYLSRTITLTAQAVFDANGEPLPWRVGTSKVSRTRIYLPLVTRNYGEAAPTATATATPSGTPSATPTGTPSGTPSATPSPTASPTISATVTVTATADIPTPTATPTATLTPVVSATPTVSPTGTSVPTTTQTPTLLPTVTPTQTLLPTVTPAPAPSATPTAVPSVTPTAHARSATRLFAILANLF